MQLNSTALLVCLTLNTVASFQSSRNKKPFKSDCSLSRFGASSSLQLAASYSSPGDEEDMASKMKDRVAKLRAEIAALEGKTVEEVEEEAQQRKKLLAEAADNNNKLMETDESKQIKRDYGKLLDVPTSREEMILQASQAIEEAYKDGITRQTVRFALLREEQYMNDYDEQWPGGAMEMYREAAKPLTRSLLEELRISKSSNNTSYKRPTVKDQDIWDFDGSGLVTAEAYEGPESDVQALVFPNTDTKYINDIATIDAAMKDRLFLLINPFWRNIDSWGINILAPNAKRKAQETIFDKGYDETYVISKFSARGENCVALKVYPNDWQIYAYLEDYYNRENAIRLGSSKQEPTTKYVSELLSQREEFKLNRNMRRLSKM